jgi:hypothetical protein
MESFGLNPQEKACTFTVKNDRINIHNNGIGRVLTMIYDTQNDWTCRICPSSGILKTRKHIVSKSGSVSELR